MRITKKDRTSIISDTKEIEDNKLARFKSLTQHSDNLVVPIKNTDQVIEMAESEYLKKFNIQTETFKEQSCRVLSILEKKGVNIYSEDNTPGMYIRQKGDNVSLSVISHLFRKKNKETDNLETIPNELKNFFKSKNK